MESCQQGGGDALYKLISFGVLFLSSIFYQFDKSGLLTVKARLLQLLLNSKLAVLSARSGRRTARVCRWSLIIVIGAM